MTYFQYLSKNSKGLILFSLAFIAFVVYCAIKDGSEFMAWNLGVAGFIFLILVGSMVGDYINYRKLK